MWHVESGMWNVASGKWQEEESLSRYSQLSAGHLNLELGVRKKWYVEFGR